eukprot:CAMPEP_0196725530 /NCGR_PEP_ID=MMETSP1091-20130531/7070_1 /TAXON_ID=302021 /ORGANISM="Rhodomonas sp., Strain CCMP768" /LENGTH=55 /DNA_ID=CAMNT_0042067827 /DNA_START=466 /DNA_END=630 /DNA_ORIENTATION=-
MAAHPLHIAFRIHEGDTDEERFSVSSTTQFVAATDEGSKDLVGGHVRHVRLSSGE